jgi:hypothetical protein
MAISEALRELKRTMIAHNLSLEAALEIVSCLTRDDQFEEMTRYIRHWSDIITDHQAVQHAKKILRREWEQQNQKN